MWESEATKVARHSMHFCMQVGGVVVDKLRDRFGCYFYYLSAMSAS